MMMMMMNLFGVVFQSQDDDDCDDADTIFLICFHVGIMVFIAH